MIKTEFGIIDEIEENKSYLCYEPEKYQCVAIDDELYIDDWWDRLVLMKTYFHTLERPEQGLSRWGVTLIPPESLEIFQDIVISDKRTHEDDNLVALANKIQEAIDGKKYMIHYGV